MKRMLACILALLLCAASLTGLAETSSEYAYVSNPNQWDRLNLRAAPDTSSKSLGKYFNGAVVRVLSREGGWCLVEVGSGDGKLTGYMMADYLSFMDARRLPVCATPVVNLRILGQMEYATLLGSEESGQPVIARLRGDTPVTVLGVCGDRAHVQFGGVTGFVNADGVCLGDGKNRTGGLQGAMLRMDGQTYHLEDDAALDTLNDMLTEAKAQGYRMAGCPFTATLYLYTHYNTVEVSLATDSCCIFRYNGYDYRYDAMDNAALFALFGVTLR